MPDPSGGTDNGSVCRLIHALPSQQCTAPAFALNHGHHGQHANTVHLPLGAQAPVSGLLDFHELVVIYPKGQVPQLLPEHVKEEKQSGELRAGPHHQDSGDAYESLQFAPSSIRQPRITKVTLRADHYFGNSTKVLCAVAENGIVGLGNSLPQPL